MKEILRKIKRAGVAIALAFGLILTVNQGAAAALVDSLRYIVGPGDQFSIEFFETQTASIKAEVSPEGMLAIPSVGAYALGGETLQRAKAILRDGLKSRFSGVVATISLSKVREQRILVSGAVENPGLYKSSATNLVSDVIAQAGGLSAGASRRNIVIRGPKSETPVDMDLFTRAGQLNANPPLYLGDVVHVPVMSDSVSRIHVSGGVRTPGWIEYTGRDRIADAIALCGGITADAKIDSVLIMRSSEDATSRTYRTIDFEEELPPGASVILLRLQKPNDQSVVVTGAVNAPGRYPFSDGVTLAESIELAGGYAADANATGVTVFSGSTLPGMASGFATFLSGTDGPMRPMAAGDSVFVPERTNYVGVYGQVSNPGMLVYQAGWNAGQYLSAAGGAAGLADLRSSEVIRHSSAAQIPFHSSAAIYDGDVIHIVARSKSENRSALATLRDIVLIGAGAALTVYSIDRMGK